MGLKIKKIIRDLFENFRLSSIFHFPFPPDHSALTINGLFILIKNLIPNKRGGTTCIPTLENGKVIRESN